MHEKFDQSIVLINSCSESEFKKGNIATGFIIHQDQRKVEELKTYVVTCGHIIEKLGGSNCLEIYSKKAYVIVNGLERKGLDLAVLVSYNNQELIDHHPLNLTYKCSLKDSVLIAGYYLYGTHDEESFHYTEGILERLIAKPIKSKNKKIKAWETRILKDGELKAGNSGSPAICIKRNLVIGLVTTKDEDGKQGQVISIEALKYVAPEIEKIINIDPETKEPLNPPETDPNKSEQGFWFKLILGKLNIEIKSLVSIVIVLIHSLNLIGHSGQLLSMTSGFSSSRSLFFPEEDFYSKMLLNKVNSKLSFIASLIFVLEILGFADEISQFLLFEEIELAESEIVVNLNNFGNLEEYLLQKDWLNADEETLKILNKLASSNSFDQLRPLGGRDIKKLEPKHLCEIDKMWMQYSDGNFGFTKQLQIYRDLSNFLDEDYSYIKRMKRDETSESDKRVWRNFCKKIRWIASSRDDLREDSCDSIAVNNSQLNSKGFFPSFRLFTYDQDSLLNSEFHFSFELLMSKLTD